MNGYEIIRTTATEAGCRVTDLLAMSNRRDPFYCGQPAQKRDAEWFADLRAALGIGANVHLRRIHYQLVSQAEPPIKPNGEPYRNTDKDWKWFCESVVAARTLGLVDVQDFVDRRNPDPLILRGDYEAEPLAFTISAPDLWFYTIDSELEEPRLILPGIEVKGYAYDDGDQPYLLEVWTEKTTMNDVLAPLCQRYRANLVTAAGFQSITAAVNLIGRAQATGKPARVFYISDFDPAGDKMPIAVARQTEYWIRQYGLDTDITLTPIALTAEQVTDYQLPRIPIKESDNRRHKFEARYGAGAVELDALEAIYPGELGRLVNEALAPYWDDRLETRMERQRAEVRNTISREWNAHIDDLSDLVEEIESDIGGVYDQFADELADLANRLNDAIGPARATLDDIEVELDRRRETFTAELPERIESDLEPPDESAWMFSSLRGYMDQLRHYRKEAA
ncbi:hypothetical protein Thiowin_00478 [Thiorhodovibrio winogradskyi]|uniref:Wadjet protein JetD C-terminal domain-containing protein n=1 Tax=Thiorhodovibrio winogradskyi TaxID=77007 RepID=A0ABZ0S4W0_9GAMM|nr:hypothetical protein [Thiorhodovibrio winogradskyi]